MAVTIRRTPKKELQNSELQNSELQDSSGVVSGGPVKRRGRGRPKGSKDRSPRKVPSSLDRKIKAISDHRKLGKAVGLIVQKLEDTASMTDDELLHAAKNVPEARGKNTGNKDGITEELAERSAIAYRLMIRGLTVEQIAEQMGVSKATAQSYVRHVQKSLRLDPKILDVGYYMGESMAFFQEVRQMALLHASSASNSVTQKLNAMRVALEAEAQKNQFLQRIGVYSPVVIERIERWLVAMTKDTFEEAPRKVERINLAAELGRLLSQRSAQSPTTDS